MSRHLTDKQVVDAFVAHRAGSDHPGLTVESRPDEQERTAAAIDAIAGRLAIEHTSIDTVDGQRRDGARFMDVVAELEREIDASLGFRLAITFPYEGVTTGQDSSAMRAALRKWILEESRSIPDGVQSVRVAGVPFEIHVEKAGPQSGRTPAVVFRRYSPSEGDLADRLRTLINRKGAKLTPHQRDGKTTVLIVESDDTSVAQYLTDWHTAQQQVGKLRRSTLSRYHDVVRDVSKSEMGLRPLQVLRETHLEAFYASVPEGSRHIYHAVIRRALKRAVKEKLLASNPAVGMDNAPTRSRQRQSEDAKINCWSEADAHRFLSVAKQEDPQTAAFFSLALDVGARRSELLGLLWGHFDADGETITIEQQLVTGRSQPEFGPVKNSKSVPSRTVHLNSETVRLLREHRRRQAEIKMENRIIYKDFGLVFAKEWGQKYSRKDQLGQPLEKTHIGGRMLDRLIAKADVKRITVHGLRHTVATLMLNAGIPVHQVAARLGDRETTIMETYAHCLKDAHREAARTLGRVLHDL